MRVKQSPTGIDLISRWALAHGSRRKTRVPKPQANARWLMVRSRAGFTLVELLVVIMLIGIMASFVLVALAGATQSAKEDRTQAQIMKIHELIMVEWEEFQYRRVPPTELMLKVQMGVNDFETQNTANLGGRLMQHRLAASREVMRMEFPSYMWDVFGDDVVGGKVRQITRESYGTMRGNSFVANKYVPRVTRAYLRRIAEAEAETGTKWTDSERFQDSECLYLILSQIRDGDESALSFFSEKEIGDLDGDGMKEILDGWGNPIRWMLWAPGYTSPLQVPFAENQQLEDNMDLSQVGSGYADTSGNGIPDAFEGDFQNLPRALYPLIYSGGADGRVGIILATDVDGAVEQNWAGALNDPFNRNTNYKMYRIGAPSEENADAMADDISNHYLTVR